MYALFIWTMPIAVDAVPPQYPVIFMRNYRDTISFIVITIAIAIVVVVVIFGCVGWLSSTIRFDWVPLLQLPVLCLCVCFFCKGILMSDAHTTHCRATRAHDGMLWCSTILLCGVSNLYAYDKTLHYYYFLKSEQSNSLYLSMMRLDFIFSCGFFHLLHRLASYSPFFMLILLSLWIRFVQHYMRIMCGFCMRYFAFFLHLGRCVCIKYEFLVHFWAEREKCVPYDKASRGKELYILISMGFEGIFSFWL